MNLSVSIPQSEVLAPAALLFITSRLISKHPRLEVRLRQAQDTKGMGDSASAAETAGATSRADVAPRRVLVVDDEALVRQMLSLFLTKAGFMVTAVESAEAALDLLRAGELCDLLVTDQSMPGMTGCELVGEMARLRPGLPALVVTGHDMVGGLEQLPGDVPVLRKPVERATFVGQVQMLLGAGEDGPEAGAGA